MIVGKGTSLLSTIKEGSTLDFSPPIGNRFTLLNNKKVAIVGGGIGIAPLFFLAKELKRQGCKTTMFLEDNLPRILFLQMNLIVYTDKLIITTNDGTIGKKGFVTDPFERILIVLILYMLAGPKRCWKLSQSCVLHIISLWKFPLTNGWLADLVHAWAVLYMLRKEIVRFKRGVAWKVLFLMAQKLYGNPYAGKI